VPSETPWSDARMASLRASLERPSTSVKRPKMR
jgi:hypothetical protein